MKNALAIAKNVVPKNPVLPILENVVLHGRTLTVSNMEQYLTVKDSGVEVRETMLLSFNQLSKIAGKVDVQKIEGIGHDDEKGWVTKARIQTTKGRFEVPSEWVEDFPTGGKYDGAVEFTFNVPDLKELSKYTGDDEHRPSMTGIYFRPDVVVATDAMRLQWDEVSTGVPSGHSFILPKGAFFIPAGTYQAGLLYVEKKGEDSEGNSKTTRKYEALRIENEDFILTTRLVDERYPDFENVIPRDNPFLMQGKRVELIETLKLALDFTNKTTCQICFTFFAGGEVQLSAQDLDWNLEYSYVFQDVSWTSVQKSHDNEIPEPIGFNGKFMLEYLVTQEAKAKQLAKSNKTKVDETFGMEFSLPIRPVIFNDHHLLMPIMLHKYS